MSSVAGSVESSASSVVNLSAASISSPFGLTKDPQSLKGTVYTTPNVLINSAIYANASKIFSYKSIGHENALDIGLKLWSVLQRKNPNGVVPNLSSFEVRSGASNAVLGYLSAASQGGKDSNGEVYPVVASGSALPYFQGQLSKFTNEKLPLSFQIAALDYDSEANALVPNYVTPLSVANALNYTVFTPLSASEAQPLALLSSVFANVSPAVNLYDGPTYLKESSRIDNVLDFETLSSTYNKLKTAVSGWESLPFVKRPSAALSALNSILGTDYKPFEYYGHKDATSVFVVYGSVESELFAKEISELALKSHLKIGVIAVRVPLPFDAEEFVSVIPESTQSLIVIGQSLDNKSSLLKTNVASTIFFNGLAKQVKVSEFIYSPSFIWSSIAVEQIIGSFIVLPKKQPNVPANLGSSVPYGDFIFWSLDNDKFVDVASKIAHAFSLDQGSIVKFRSKFDNLIAGGVYQAQISSTKSDSKLESPTVGAVDRADLVVVETLEILKNLNVVKTIKQKGTIVLVHQDLPKDLQSFVDSLPVQFRRNVAKNENKVVIVDLATIGDYAQTQGRTGLIAIQSIFWKYSAPQLNINDIVRRVLHASGSDIELLPAVLVSIITDIFEKGIKEVQFDPKWAELPIEENEVTLPIFPTESSFEPNPRSTPEPEQPEETSYVEIAKKFAFGEAYGIDNNLRPDLPVRNFVVKVQENRRVTPNDYSRNIFHIEFDITGTGLTYDIGEALGVHGRNDPEEVLRFLEFYGLNPEELVQVPNRDNSDIVEVRTVYQAFTENLDLLGKPPKRFYESLAAFASDENEKKKLKLVASAEGAPELKKYQDEEFYSFSDILELFPSAKPSLTELLSIIPPLKRREYSIASSQKMHPNAVHLLIVVVDWVDNRKRKRFGQCSRYLSQLSIGSELVVSVKPSVMKLPPLSTQPIVMSGLGTGLAPFKAFVEEKIWQKQQGLEIGEVYLYLGARHRKEEYLYGELWEAFKAAGVITHIGAAFSRDQPEKIYIQDRIRQTLPELKEAIIKKNGSFYLCGPTWPVPDITAALEDIVAEEAKERGVEVDAAREVEELKETSRYILEVY